MNKRNYNLGNFYDKSNIRSSLNERLVKCVLKKALSSVEKGLNIG